MLKKLQSSNILLIVGCILLLIGYFGPMIAQNHISLNEDIVLEAPYDPELLELSKPIIEALDGSASDGKALAKLYRDIAILISLNEDIIRTTEEIREANKLSGLMLQLNLKDKYPNLAEAANAMVAAYIGDDNVMLSDELRQKSVNVFKALAWACNEGSK